MSTATRTPPSVINTAKVANRRILRFETIDQMLAEVDRLVAAEQTGRLKQLGNWTLGQTLGHLAGWSEFGYTRAPLNPPFFIRWILKFMRKKFIHGPMPAGAKIPGVPGGTLVTEPMSVEDGLNRFRSIIERVKAEPPTVPSPALGMLTHEESIALNLRHAELHLGFYIPE
jgi:hypothetical protein